MIHLKNPAILVNFRSNDAGVGIGRRAISTVGNKVVAVSIERDPEKIITVHPRIGCSRINESLSSRSWIHADNPGTSVSHNEAAALLDYDAGRLQKVRRPAGDELLAPVRLDEGKNAYTTIGTRTARIGYHDVISAKVICFTVWARLGSQLRQRRGRPESQAGPCNSHCT